MFVALCCQDHQIFMWFLQTPQHYGKCSDHVPTGRSLLNSLFLQLQKEDPSLLSAGRGEELSLLLSPFWDKNIDRQRLSDNWLLLNSNLRGPAVPNLSHWCKNNQSAGIEAIMGNSAVEQSCIRIPGLTSGWHSKVIEWRAQGLSKIVGRWNQFLYELVLEACNLYFNLLIGRLSEFFTPGRCIEGYNHISKGLFVLFLNIQPFCPNVSI